MTAPNPHSRDNKRETVREAVTSASIGYGWVTDYFPKTAQIEVQPIGENPSHTANVSVPMDGSIAVPHSEKEQDLLVVYAKLSVHNPVALGFFYDPLDISEEGLEKQSVPTKQDGSTVEAGERIVGHQLSDTHILFDKDGNITVYSENDITVTSTGTTYVESDTDVVINGGSKGVIHDITTTTSNGYVTSVTPERRSDILI